MRGDMIGLCVADEDVFRTGLRILRIQPQSKLRQVHPASAKFQS
jgi:hypothetical protein